MLVYEYVGYTFYFILVFKGTPKQPGMLMEGEDSKIYTIFIYLLQQNYLLEKVPIYGWCCVLLAANRPC